MTFHWAARSWTSADEISSACRVIDPNSLCGLSRIGFWQVPTAFQARFYMAIIPEPFLGALLYGQQQSAIGFIIILLGLVYWILGIVYYDSLPKSPFPLSYLIFLLSYLIHFPSYLISSPDASNASLCGTTGV